jgi:hypothetical protein
MMTTNALKDHAQEFRDLAAEIDKVEQKYKDDLAAALEDYQRKLRRSTARSAKKNGALPMNITGRWRNAPGPYPTS